MEASNTFSTKLLDLVPYNLPSQRDVIRYLTQKTFRNPLIQKSFDYLKENGCIASIRDQLIPLFEASEVVRKKILELGDKLGLIQEKYFRLHTPKRLNNPNTGYIFYEDFLSGYEFDQKKEKPKELDVLFCSPSNYRDTKVRRYFLGLLPQAANHVLEALTPKSIDGVPVKVAEYDDKKDEGIPIEDIIEHCIKNPEHEIVICLTSVQTNQFTRAYDIALQLKSLALELGLNIEILMGGPHIQAHKASCENLVELGVIPVAGEMEENRFQNILADILHDRNQKEYSFDDPVDISNAELPIPEIKKGYASPVVLFQASRGCPNGCTFCSVMQLEGKKMRCKTVKEVEVEYREAIKNKVETMFLTDNNFLRNRNCRKILKMMSRVRKETGSNIKIMFQSDLKVTKNGQIDIEFMELCRDAGVFMIFFGQESYDPEELIRMNKRHNLIHIARICDKRIEELSQEDVKEYTKMFVRAWKDNGVATNLTSMVGLPGHRKGIGKEIAELAVELDVDIVSPYIYTLLPGSKEYEIYVTSLNAEENRKKVGMKIIDLQFNSADSIHPTVEFEGGLNGKEQTEEFLSLMRTFYKLSRINGKQWNPSVLSYYLHHCLAAALEEHPMAMGLWRKENTERELSETLRSDLKRYIRSKLEKDTKIGSKEQKIIFDKPENFPLAIDKQTTNQGNATQIS